jgi:hypothetical protein
VPERGKRWARESKRDVLAVGIAARDPRVPWYAKCVEAGVAASALPPIDLIPDVSGPTGLSLSARLDHIWIHYCVQWHVMEDGWDHWYEMQNLGVELGCIRRAPAPLIQADNHE